MPRIYAWGNNWGKVTHVFRPISAKADFTNLA